MVTASTSLDASKAAGKSVIEFEEGVGAHIEPLQSESARNWVNWAIESCVAIEEIPTEKTGDLALLREAKETLQ